MDICTSLTKAELENILKNKYAKYLSQHDINRHYIIKYNDNNNFINETYENNKKIGEGYGNYYILENEHNEAIMNVQYKSVFHSPNKDSPFHPHNSFYSQLKDYKIGPFYGNIPNVEVNWLPILYKHLIKNRGFKVLNFYNK